MTDGQPTATEPAGSDRMGPPGGSHHDPPGPEIVDLLPWLDRDEVQTLLAVSMDRPGPAVLTRLVRWYRGAPAPVVVLGLHHDGRLLGLIGAVVRPGDRCEVLNLAVDPTARGRGHARRLVGLAAAALQATEVIAHTDAEAVGFYRACGFTLTAVGEVAPGVVRYRAERPAAGLSDEAWFSAPRTHRIDARTLLIELPPGGNTLPTVPEVLADGPVPTFVVEWVLETHEIGLILQTLLPQRFPPTTPPIRPSHVEEFLGRTRPSTVSDPPVSAVTPGPSTSWDDADATIPGLPAGLDLPLAVQQVAEMGQRLAAWLAKGARVRQWAEAQGHGDAPWLLPLRWATDGSADSPDASTTPDDPRHPGERPRSSDAGGPPGSAPGGRP